MTIDDGSRQRAWPSDAKLVKFARISGLESVNCIKLSLRHNRLLHPRRLMAVGKNCPPRQQPGPLHAQVSAGAGRIRAID